MQPKEYLETEQQKSERAGSVLNFLANFAQDPIERLKSRRVRVAAQLAAMIATVGATHAKVSDKSGIKPSQLSRQLSGDTNLTLDTISRICDALGADFDIVFRKSNQSAAKQWWEHDRSSIEHFSAAIYEFAKSAQSEPTLPEGRNKLAFSMDLNEVVGCAGRVHYINNQAKNDESKLIAA